jgi:CRISPR-associated protein Cas1
LNEKRKDAFLTERIKQMTVLERQLIKVYKDGEKLKGLEGNIAKHFFACIRYLLPKETGFEERNKDGTDIYNSLLNTAHGLLRAKIAKILWTKGINSSFGFLHFQKDKNKPFLVWDFSELWVPYVDKLCFYAINKGIFSEKDLINAKEGNGKWLNKQGWQKLYRIFEERINEKEIEKKIGEFCDYLDEKRKKFRWTLSESE